MDDLNPTATVVTEVQTQNAEDKIALLTPQQLNILELSYEGLSGAAIAARMNLSEKTVKFHKTRLFKRLNVQSVLQAIAVYREAKGFTPVPPEKIKGKYEAIRAINAQLKKDLASARAANKQLESDLLYARAAVTKAKQQEREMAKDVKVGITRKKRAPRLPVGAASIQLPVGAFK